MLSSSRPFYIVVVSPDCPWARTGDARTKPTAMAKCRTKKTTKKRASAAKPRRSKSAKAAKVRKINSPAADPIFTSNRSHPRESVVISREADACRWLRRPNTTSPRKFSKSKSCLQYHSRVPSFRRSCWTRSSVGPLCQQS